MRMTGRERREQILGIAEEEFATAGLYVDIVFDRAYFGVPESAATDADGRPVNAIRGFVDMLATLIRTRRPDRVVCALDNSWRPGGRRGGSS